MKIKRLSEDNVVVTLSRRNLEVLLAKLDEEESACTILSPCRTMLVHAEENEEHYADREPGPMLVKGEWI